MLTGYILAGLLIGPHCLGLVTTKEHIDGLAVLGVALLLFALGVELSLKQIFTANKKVVVAGVLQVVFTVLTGFFLSQAVGLTDSLAGALLFGSVCALSSTVVVTRVLGDRGELSSTQGSIMIGILIIQDLALVPIISLLSAFSSNYGASDIASGMFFAAVKAIVLIGVIILGATRVVPRILGKAARTGSSEIFQLTVMSICLLTAVLSSGLGMSLELGAFLAGIMVSESIYGYQALADIHPMKDLFSIVFFVTVGMLINPGFVFTNWPLIVGFVTALFVIKTLITAGCARIAISSSQLSLLVGLGLAQIGEFSFVLATLGKSMGIITGDLYDLYISASVITLILSPFVITLAPVLLSPARDNIISDSEAASFEKMDLTDHLVLCGFGVVGHNIAHVMQQYSIPFVVVEFNALFIEELDERGIRYIYGDASNKIILEQSAIERAKVIVVSIGDHITAANIIQAALNLNPDLKVIARAHAQAEAEFIKSSGAHAVIQSEFETSIEFTKQTLFGLEISMPEIKRVLSGLEERRYSALEGDLSLNVVSNMMPFPVADVITVWTKLNHDRLNGQSIEEIEFRNKTGCTIVAIRRNDETIAYPKPDFVLNEGDELCVVGNISQIEKVEAKFALAKFTRITN